MQIILLDENRFSYYAKNHPNSNYYQTTSYGQMMSKKGYNSYYIGLTDDIGNINAATLLIVKNDNSNKRKIAYAPRGFLIDWNDKDLVKEFTIQIKDFLSKRNFTHIKIDPAIIYKEHNNDDITNTINDNGTSFVSNLQSLGYIHLGYNNSSETNCYRWNCTMNLDSNIVSVFNKLSKNTRDKIKRAANSGISIYKGSGTDINLLSSISNNTISAEHLMDYYQFFGENFEIYFAKFEPYSFVNSSKLLYEKEEAKNARLNAIMQDMSVANKNDYINMKMESDNLIASYKKDMQEASNLFQQYPNGIAVAGIALIKNNDTITIIASYTDTNFERQFPGYLLKWQLIQEFSKRKYRLFDFGGIVMEYQKNKMMQENVDLSDKIIEYYGEFDLVINKKSYYTGSKLNPILSWLNTPI